MKKSDSKTLEVLQESCDRMTRVFLPGEDVHTFRKTFESELRQSFPGIRFTGLNKKTADIPMGEAWDFLWNGSESSTISGPVFRTTTGETVMLAVTRDGSSSEGTPLRAVLGYGSGSGGPYPIPARATLADYSRFLGSLSRRTVLEGGLTSKQAEMISALQKSRLAHSYGGGSIQRPGSYGLTLGGKALYLFLRRRWISFPLAAGFAVLVLLSNVNSALDLACKVADLPWCP